MEKKYSASKPVTIERIKQIKRFEHLSDEQAQAIIETYRLLAYSIYDVFKLVPEHEQKQFIRNI